MRNPEELVAAVFAALNTEDWHTLTTLCDPMGLAIFKGHTLRLLSRYAEDCDTGDEFSDGFGNEEVHLVDILRFELAGVESYREIEEMDAGRVFVRWLQARTFKNRIEPWRQGSEESAHRTVRSYKYSVLGSVADGEEFVHAIYRQTIDLSEWHPEIYDNVWKERSDEERGFVEAMHQRGDPSIAVCRRQSDGLWKMIPKRTFWLVDSEDVVEVRGNDK